MKKNSDNIFFIITITIFFILYLIFQPKILPKLFNARNNKIFNDFLLKTEKTKKIGVQEFWQMREFYCPSSLVFDKTKNPFLTYSCKWLKSEDYLLTPEYVNKLFPKEKFLISKDDKKIVIAFVMPISEMKKAVGYFDYEEKDKEFVKNKYWYNITKINL